MIIPEFVNVKIMKATQLKNIIKESINQLIKEQSNSSITVSPGDIVAVAAVYPSGIVNSQDLPSPLNMTPNQNPYYFIGVPGAYQNFPGGIEISPIGVSSIGSCGHAKAFDIQNQAQADAFNSAMNGEMGVYLELVSNPNSIPNSVDNVLAQLSADFQGSGNLQPGSTLTSQCYYMGPGSTSNYSPTGVPGCTDPAYDEYNANATYDDGSCANLTPIPGCMDSTASNFDPNATVPGGSGGQFGGCEWECTDPSYEGCGQSTSLPPILWAQTPSGINPSCNNLVSDGQAYIDANQIEGCNDSSATNYDPNATGCLATAQSFGGADPVGSGHGYIAPGEFEANLCGATFTGITDPDNTDCCTYVSGAGTPNLVNPVQQTPASFAPNKVADQQLDPSTLPGTDMRTDTGMKDRMQKLANIKPRRK